MDGRRAKPLKRSPRSAKAAGVPWLHTRLQGPARLKRLARRCLSPDRKSTRLNSSHSQISYAVFCLKKKKMCIVIIACGDCQCLQGEKLSPGYCGRKPNRTCSVAPVLVARWQSKSEWEVRRTTHERC